MTNRFFARPVTYFAISRFDLTLRFNDDRHQAFGAELAEQLVELEQRQEGHTSMLLVDQKTAAASDNPCGDADQPCTYDDFGLVQGLEIDVRWI